MDINLITVTFIIINKDIGLFITHKRVHDCDHRISCCRTKLKVRELETSAADWLASEGGNEFVCNHLATSFIVR
jgi:hypothetical protein